MPPEPKPQRSLDSVPLDRLATALFSEPPAIRSTASLDAVTIPPLPSRPLQGPPGPAVHSSARTEALPLEPAIPTPTATSYDFVAFPPIQSSAPFELALDGPSVSSRPPAIPTTTPLPTTSPIVGTDTPSIDGWSGVSGLLGTIADGIQALVRAGRQQPEAPAYSGEHPIRAQREDS